MKVVNKVDIRLENFDKCNVISDSDCSLGQLYDYACAFKSFIAQKIQESEALSQSAKEPDIAPEVAKAE